MKKILLGLLVLLSFSAAFAGDWYVCAGSYAIEKNAIEFQEKMEKGGFPTVIKTSARPDGSTLYRVLLNIPTESKELANSLCKNFASSSFCQKNKVHGVWLVEVEKVAPVPVDAAAEMQAPETAEPVIQVEGKTIPKQEVLAANQEVIISEEKPYSLLIQSYKEESVAQNDQARLLKEDIETYILRKLREHENILFDLHAGAAETQEELEEIAQRLDELEINYDYTDFNDFADEIEAYNETVTSQAVTFDNGVATFPAMLSKDVQNAITYMPVNLNYQIDGFYILDAENYREAGKDLSRTLPYLLDDLESSMKAFCSATLKDALFDHQINVCSAVVDADLEEFFAPALELAATQNLDEYAFSKKNILGLSFDVLCGEDDGDNVMVAWNAEKGIVTYLLDEKLTFEKFQELVEQCLTDSTPLIYPQIRKTLAILPDQLDPPVLFLDYGLKKVGRDYVDSRFGADWAWGIFGHWQAETNVYSEDGELSLASFDLDYDYNASDVHGLFMKDKNENLISDNNHPYNVNGKSGWFINKELSFSHKSYIFALNDFRSCSDAPDEELLEEIAKSLKIWE